MNKIETVEKNDKINSTLKRSMSYTDHYSQLNDKQQAAVDAIDGPVMILAGPGTGKTQLLSVRTANILQQTDLYPSNILVLTYTNAGVHAMKERLRKIIGHNGYDIKVETFHGFANSIITESEEAVNLIKERIQITDVEKVSAIEYLLDNLPAEIIKAIRPAGAPYIYRMDIEQNISELIREGITPKKLKQTLSELSADNIYVEQKHLPRLRAFVELYEKYEELKKGNFGNIFDNRGRYDYDDMIVLAIKIFESEPDLLAKYQEQYQYIMVDEFQDTNGAQLQLLFTLTNYESPNLCVVGDDDQSIFRFQGASTANFKIIRKKHSQVQVIALDENYRSTDEIINLSKKISNCIPLSERVKEKNLIAKKKHSGKEIDCQTFGTKEEEISFILKKITELQQQGISLSDMAILTRKRKDIELLINAFLQAGIPYATDGKEDIRGEKRVKQLLLILKMAAMKKNPAMKEKVLIQLLNCDFWKIPARDLVMFLAFIKKLKDDYLRNREKFAEKPGLFPEMLKIFPLPKRNEENRNNPPTEQETKLALNKYFGTGEKQLTLDLKVEEQPTNNKYLRFDAPNRFHRAAWAIARLMEDSENRPIHAMLMEFIRDAEVFNFILKKYDREDILRIRELRALSAFINKIKTSALSKPELRLKDFLEELKIRDSHNLNITGELVSSHQEGVRIYTAHGSKGLEFQVVFIPFCLQSTNWPKRELPHKIPLPPQLFPTKEIAEDKKYIDKLHYFDETRLFYTASTRAKSHLFFTASPQKKQIISSYLDELALVPSQNTVISEENLLISSITIQDHPDFIINNEDLLDDFIRTLTLNPSSINTYIVCPRKFLYNNLLLIPAEPKANLVFGTCVHKALENVYKKYVQTNTFPDFGFFLKTFNETLNFEGVDQTIKQTIQSKMENLKKWYEANTKEPVMPLALEKKYSVDLPCGVTLRGQFDKVEHISKEKRTVKLLDYKTGKPDDHIRDIERIKNLKNEKCDDYLRQLTAYKLLYEKQPQNRGTKAIYGELVFVEPVQKTVKKYETTGGEFINKTVAITDDMVKEFTDLICEIWKKIKAHKFEKLAEFDTKKCNWCNYRDICWE